jgi:hypothetical protein
MDAQQIVDDIVAYVGSDTLSNWYVGITSDARKCLFERHKVNEKTGRWIYRTADSNKLARAIERALLKAGFDGGPGGGDERTRCVYAYQKSWTTSED